MERIFPLLLVHSPNDRSSWSWGTSFGSPTGNQELQPSPTAFLESEVEKPLLKWDAGAGGGLMYYAMVMIRYCYFNYFIICLHLLFLFIYFIHMYSRTQVVLRCLSSLHRELDWKWALGLLQICCNLLSPSITDRGHVPSHTVNTCVIAFSFPLKWLQNW